MNKQWLRAAGIRAIKTMAQTAVGMMAVGMGILEVDWPSIGGAALVAGVMSFLTSIEGLPEASTVTETKTAKTESEGN